MQNPLLALFIPIEMPLYAFLALIAIAVGSAIILYDSGLSLGLDLTSEAQVPTEWNDK